MPEATYYARRSLRDPAWREQQLREAAERARRRLELDPDAVRRSNAASARRVRRRQAAEGLTFYELWQRVGGDRQALAHVLSDEPRSGRIEYPSTSRRYLLNGELDAETRAALLAFAPLDRDHSTPAAHANCLAACDDGGRGQTEQVSEVPPREVVLREVKLGETHAPTGRTRHHVGGVLMPPPAALRIVRYGQQEGFYLLYLNEGDEEMTDTWHATLEDALAQAEFEFRVAPSEWRQLDSQP